MSAVTDEPGGHPDQPPLRRPRGHGGGIDSSWADLRGPDTGPVTGRLRRRTADAGIDARGAAHAPGDRVVDVTRSDQPTRSALPTRSAQPTRSSQPTRSAQTDHVAPPPQPVVSSSLFETARPEPPKSAAADRATRPWWAAAGASADSGSAVAAFAPAEREPWIPDSARVEPAYAPPVDPAPSYPGPSYPAPSYPAPGYSASGYSASSYPASGYPVPSSAQPVDDWAVDPAPPYPAVIDIRDPVAPASAYVLSAHHAVAGPVLQGRAVQDRAVLDPAGPDLAVGDPAPSGVNWLHRGSAAEQAGAAPDRPGSPPAVPVDPLHGVRGAPDVPTPSGSFGAAPSVGPAAGDPAPAGPGMPGWSRRSRRSGPDPREPQMLLSASHQPFDQSTGPQPGDQPDHPTSAGDPPASRRARRAQAGGVQAGSAASVTDPDATTVIGRRGRGAARDRDVPRGVEAESAQSTVPGTLRARAGRNLPAAIAVGLVLGGLVLASLFVRKEGFVALVSAAVVLAVWELAGALTTKQIAIPVIPLAVGSVGMLVSAFVAGEQGLLVSYALTGFGVLLWRVIDGFAGAVRDVAAGVFTAAYVPFLAGFAMLLLAAPDGPRRVVTFILVTIASDIGGYLAGVLWGRHPMAPHISPKKSWEGFAGSVVGCMIAGAGSVTVLLHGPWWAGPVLGVAVAVTATVGDLSESLLKRDLGVKDMGTVLPGHGGMMDRLDSLLPCAPVVFLLLTAMVPAL